MSVAADENMLDKSELSVIYSTMLNMIGKHSNGVGAIKRIKAAEARCAYEDQFDDPDYSAYEPGKTWVFYMPNTGDKGKNTPKK